MKQKSFFTLTVLLVTLSLAFSSCYMGYYQPFPRYGYGGGYGRVYGPRYNNGGGMHHGGGGHYGGGGYRGGGRR